MKNVNNMRFKKTQVKPNSEIKFDVDLLELYLAIDERKNVVSLFKEVGLPPEVFKQSFIKLIKLKLIEEIKEEERSKNTNGSFLERTREIAIKLSGPMGALLVEDAAREMEFDTLKSTDPQRADLVYKIAAAIPSYKQAIEFKRIMLNEISTSQNDSLHP